jgi:hypothetical protein
MSNEPHYLKPPKTRRDLLDSHGMPDYKIPMVPSNIANVMEGRTADDLAFVFKQLEEIGVKRNAEG